MKDHAKHDEDDEPEELANDEQANCNRDVLKDDVIDDLNKQSGPGDGKHQNGTTSIRYVTDRKARAAELTTTVGSNQGRKLTAGIEHKTHRTMTPTCIKAKCH